MKTNSVVMLKVTQSMGRNNGGTTGLDGGGAPPAGGTGALPSPGPPATGFLPFAFFGLVKLILDIQSYQKTKDELSKNERHLSIQKWCLAGHSARFGRRPRSRLRNRD